MDCLYYGAETEIEAVSRRTDSRGWDIMTIARKAINGSNDKLAILKEVLTLSDDVVNVYLVKNHPSSIPDSINITEELAELYCDIYLGDEDDDDINQTFISGSRAYERRIRSREALAYEDATFGSYTDQHRLRQQDVL